MKKKSFLQKYLLLFFLLVVVSIQETKAQSIYSVSKFGRSGIVNSEFETILPLKYNNCEVVADSFAIVEKSNLYGLVDHNGNFILDLFYDKISFINIDVFLVQENDKKFIFEAINKNKTYIENYFIYSFWGNKLVISIDNKTIIISDFDLERKSFEFDSISRIIINDNSYTLADYFLSDEYYYLTYKDEKKGVLSRDLNVIIEPLFTSITYQNPYYFVENKKLKGLYSETGKEIISPIFFDISYFKDVIIVQNEYKGIYSKNGEIIIPAEYDDISVQSDNNYKVSKNNKFGLIDNSGIILTNLEYDNLNYAGAESYIVSSGKKWGLLNDKGKIVVPLQYNSLKKTINPNIFCVSSFSTDLISNEQISKKIDLEISEDKELKKHYKYGLVSNHGNLLIDTLYYEQQILVTNDYAIIKKDKEMRLVFILNKDGTIADKMEVKYFKAISLTPKENYDNVWRENNNRRYEEEYKRWGLFTYQGLKLIDFSYKQLFFNFQGNPDITMVMDYGGYYGIVNDKKGKEVLSPLFVNINQDDFLVSNVARCYSKSGLCRLINNEGEPIEGLYSCYVDDFQNNSTRICSGAKFIKSKDQKFTLNVNGYYNKEFYYLTKNGYWGIIDTSGKILVSKKYKFIQKQFRNEYIAMDTKKRWGVISPNGNVIIPFEYNHITHFEGEKTQLWLEIPFYKVKKGNKCGVVDSANNMVLDIIYEDVKYLEANDTIYWGIKKDGKWGLINEFKNEIIPFKFDEITYLKDRSLSVFLAKNNHIRSGFIDTSCFNNTPPYYLAAHQFNEGFAAVELEEGWTFVNKKFEPISKERYLDCKDFSEGFAAVKVDTGWGFIDTTGLIVIKPQYFDVGGFYSGLSWFKTDKKKIGYISQENKIVYKPKFKDATNFIGEIAFVKKKRNYAKIKPRKSLIFLYKFKKIVPYPDLNLFFVLNYKSQKTYLNSKGEKLFKYNTYDGVGQFVEEMATVICKNKTKGFIDTSGTLIIDGLNTCSDFTNGFSLVYSNYNTNTFRYIDKKGECFNYRVRYSEDIGLFQTNDHFYFAYEDNTRTPYDFEEAQPFNNGKAIVKLNNGYGIINKNGTFIMPTVLTEIKDYKENYAVYSIKEQAGVYNSNGVEIYPPYALAVEYINDNLIKIFLNNRIIYINMNGNIVWE
ncbi:MAG: WG repeat-containing protein [Bacteroidales bacterium]|nr:WG repeat-containing protein [Bacteroidales bacterium]